MRVSFRLTNDQLYTSFRTLTLKGVSSRKLHSTANPHFYVAVSNNADAVVDLLTQVLRYPSLRFVYGGQFYRNISLQKQCCHYSG